MDSYKVILSDSENWGQELRLTIPLSRACTGFEGVRYHSGPATARFTGVINNGTCPPLSRKEAARNACRLSLFLYHTIITRNTPDSSLLP